LLICLSGMLGGDLFLVREGQVEGSEHMYQMRGRESGQGKERSEHYPVHIAAMTDSVVAEIGREDIEKGFGEELYQVVNKNAIVSLLSKVQALSFLPA